MSGRTIARTIARETRGATRTKKGVTKRTGAMKKTKKKRKK
jgi:hypothetical protein